MAQHITPLIRLGLIPAILMIAGIDDQNVAFFDLDARGDILRGIDPKVLGHITQIDDDTRSDQLIHLEAGNVTSGGIKVYRAIEVSPDVV